MHTKLPTPYPPNYLMTSVLLLISFFHIMIFSFFQIYGNFLNLEFSSVLIPLKSFFYAVVVLTSVSHQFFVRNFSLKSVLMAGLVFNILGLCLIWLSLSEGGSLPLIFLSMFFIGLSLTSVINCLISYMVIEFSQRIGFLLLTLFAFGNAGNMTSNILFNVFKASNFSAGFFILTIGSMLVLLFYVALKFFNPEFPKYLEHLRKGTLLWKELHYRLIFFILCIIAYGFVQSIFGLWSGLYLLKFLSQEVTKDTVSLFWFSMLIGQILFLIPLYFYPPRKVFPFLVLLLIFTLFFYERQTELPGFILSVVLAGIGCAAIFPILLSFMEEEVVELSVQSRQENYLPFIETGTCLMVGGYFVGVGIMDIWVLKYIEHPKVPLNFMFHWGIITISCLGLFSTYLNWSTSHSED